MLLDDQWSCPRRLVICIYKIPFELKIRNPLDAQIIAQGDIREDKHLCNAKGDKGEFCCTCVHPALTFIGDQAQLLPRSIQFSDRPVLACKLVGII